MHGGNLFYVNGLPTINSEYPDPGLDGPPLILADLLHEYFGTGVGGSRKALVRLEDVSVHINPERIIEAADYLYEQRVPFSLGVIPAQRFEDGRVVPLTQKPELVRALRYAQDRGGTIILHGYHHTFDTGEGYEYWDEARDAPLEGETWEEYAFKTEDGVRILRDQGLEPRFWETPHYAASPLAYRVFSRYFSHAVENRRTSGWLPYPTGPDEYGQILIPENLGYINPEQGLTVEAQLRRAETLGAVRDAWAVGFYHPASIPVSELESLVEGLREQGYAFADLRALETEVRSDHRPGLLARAATWARVDLALYGVALDRDLEQWSPWWPVVRRVPWLTVLIAGMMAVFLIRLPEQWRSTTTAAQSLVELPKADGSRSRALRPPIFLSVVLTILLAVGFWASSWGPDERGGARRPRRGPFERVERHGLDGRVRRLRGGGRRGRRRGPEPEARAEDRRDPRGTRARRGYGAARLQLQDAHEVRGSAPPELPAEHLVDGVALLPLRGRGPQLLPCPQDQRPGAREAGAARGHGPGVPGDQARPAGSAGALVRLPHRRRGPDDPGLRGRQATHRLHGPRPDPPGARGSLHRGCPRPLPKPDRNQAPLTAVLTTVERRVGSRSGRRSPRVLGRDRSSARPVASTSAPSMHAAASLSSAWTFGKDSSIGKKSGE